jgi:UDP-2-acetamido-2-deoxy-ribo-hexuluronate aminotransferase
MLQVKTVDLHRQYLSIREEIEAALHSVLESCEFIQGRAVRDFEADLSQWMGTKHAIGCSSGTGALQVSLMALGIGPGDEVITSPFTFAAIAETVILLGGRPVFADIEPRTFNIDPQQIAARINSRTRAIIPVHLYGQPAEMNAIQRLAHQHGLKVIEDAAQAIGALYGSHRAGAIGDIGCLSFYPTKNLGAYGDAGAILTDDDALAEKCRMIVDHGCRIKYWHERLGVNCRLDSLQAAILGVKLRRLNRWTETRLQVAEKYNQALADLDLMLPSKAPQATHVYHQYSIRTRSRDPLSTFLKSRGIATSIHYPTPLHRQPAFASFHGDAPLIESEAAAREVLCLPIYPELEDKEVEYVVATIREFFAQ